MNNSERLAFMAKEGAKISQHGSMCNGCAFKSGTDANLEVHNVRSAMECVAYTGTFYCHVVSANDPIKICAGYLYARAFGENTIDSSTVNK